MSTPDQIHKEELKALISGASLTEDQADAIYAQGREAVIWALLQLFAQAREAGKNSLSTPSGMIPLYEKPSVKKGRKQAGRKKGHTGSRRKEPLSIDQYKDHPLKKCPYCDTLLGKPSAHRKRIIEDMPDSIEPVITEHTIPRTYCPTCKKIVEPLVDDALPKAKIGNHLVAFTAWLHYGLGTTISQITSVLSSHVHFHLSPGGLVDMWHRLAEILDVWYQQIAEQIKDSAVLHIDETGWRVLGKTYWLWCFTTPKATFYLIDRSRGSPVLQRFFADEFAGILITDFWGAYNKLRAVLRQTCWVHLFREMEKVDTYLDTSDDWRSFAKKLKRIMRDGLRLKKSSDIGEQKYNTLKGRLHVRLDNMIKKEWKNTNARRLVKRLRRHQNDMFTFLDYDDVPSDNNHAEREIRPAVIMRKNIYANRSKKGAYTQAVMMSVYRTLKLRNHDPIKIIAAAMATYIRTGKLPPLPE
jgi:transposase